MVSSIPNPVFAYTVTATVTATVIVVCAGGGGGGAAATTTENANIQPAAGGDTSKRKGPKGSGKKGMTCGTATHSHNHSHASFAVNAHLGIAPDRAPLKDMADQPLPAAGKKRERSSFEP